MSSTNNYDKIAAQYDFLSRLVFFKAQVNAQKEQLPQIPAGSRLLIAGGGTGWILEEIAKIHPSGLHITYVEISSKMIALAKAKNCGQNQVEFVHAAIEEYQSVQEFDVILTPFLFDNFFADKAKSVFFLLHEYLKPKGLWFFVDFQLHEKDGKWWKFLLLKSMYIFFKTLGMVEANQLIDMSPYFSAHRFKIIYQKFYYAHFICATTYQK